MTRTSPPACPRCRGSRRVVLVHSTDGMWQGLHFSFARCGMCRGLGTAKPSDAAPPGAHRWPGTTLTRQETP